MDDAGVAHHGTKHTRTFKHVEHVVDRVHGMHRQHLVARSSARMSDTRQRIKLRLARIGVTRRKVQTHFANEPGTRNKTVQAIPISSNVVFANPPGMQARTRAHGGGVRKRNPLLGELHRRHRIREHPHASGRKSPRRLYRIFAKPQVTMHVEISGLVHAHAPPTTRRTTLVDKP